VGCDETVDARTARGLPEALCRMGTCQFFMHELHLGAPVQDVRLMVWCGRRDRPARVGTG